MYFERQSDLTLANGNDLTGTDWNSQLVQTYLLVIDFTLAEEFHQLVLESAN